MKKKHKQYYPHWRPGIDIKRQRRRIRSRNLIFSLGVLIFVLIAIISVHLFLYPVGKRSSDGFAYIKRNTTVDELILQLDTTINLSTPKLFKVYSQLVSLDNRIRPGKYAIRGSMSSMDLLKALIYNPQVPVKIGFNALRTQENLIKTLTHNLEISEEQLRLKLQDPIYCASMGCDTSTIRTIFLPDSYEVYWNTSPEQLVEKFYKEYQKFWTPKRLAKAESEGLSPQQISIIASIVEEESSKIEEYSRIAGLYINRLRKGIPLQADPTVKYALRDFTLKRILTIHTMVKSPYNTYYVVGLPPGPIRYPQKSTLEKVLNFEHHKYLYMCAKSDFSGFHEFATNYTDHLQNAYQYRRKLDKIGIK